MSFRTIICIAAIVVLIFVCVIFCTKWSGGTNDPLVTESPGFILMTAPPTPEPSPEATDAPPSELLELTAVEVEEIKKTMEQEVKPPEKPTLATVQDIDKIGRTIWGEAGGCTDKDHQAAVAWTILNRVDEGYGTIEEVITAPYQFQGYIYWEDECPEEFLELAADVVERWEWEHAGVEEVGRVLPKGYCWFRAYDGHNRFRNAYDGDYDVWDWSLESPYD